MRDAIIHKRLAALGVVPNMADWNAARAAFSWDQVREELGARAEDFNIARLAVDRHTRGAGADRIALRHLPAVGEARTLSYAELQRQTDRFANGLRALGVGKGDRVFILAGRIPPLVVAALGSLKIGCVA